MQVYHIGHERVLTSIYSRPLFTKHNVSILRRQQTSPELDFCQPVFHHHNSCHVSGLSPRRRYSSHSTVLRPLLDEPKNKGWNSLRRPGSHATQKGFTHGRLNSWVCPDCLRSARRSHSSLTRAAEAERELESPNDTHAELEDTEVSDADKRQKSGRSVSRTENSGMQAPNLIPPLGNKFSATEQEATGRREGVLAPLRKIASDDQAGKEDELSNFARTVHKLLPPGTPVHSNTHFDRCGRDLQTRKDKVKWINLKHARLRQARRFSDAGVKRVWQNIYGYMKVHSPQVPSELSALSVSGHPFMLGQLQRQLKTRKLNYESIVRFGKTWVMLVSGPEAQLAPLRQSLKQSNHVKIISSGKSVDSSALSAPRDDSPNPMVEDQSDESQSAAPPGDETQSATPPVESSKATDETKLFKRIVKELTGKSKKEAKVPVIVSQLMTMFDGARGSEIVTDKALQRALRYLLRFRAIPEANELLLRMTDFGCTPSTATFNVLLHSCAKDQNLSAFKATVERMIKMGLGFDSASWVAFLKITPHTIWRAGVLRHMQREGLFRYGNTRVRIAVPIIRQGLGLYLDNGGALSDYMTGLSQFCGESWHSPGAVLALVDVLVARDKFLLAIDLVSMFHENYGFRPNIALLNVFIRHYYTHRDLSRAVQVLYVFAQKWPSLRMDLFTMDRMWRLAWKLHYYNLARIVWKYACAQGLTNSNMRSSLLNSVCDGLISALGSHEEVGRTRTYQDKWICTAGRFVLGRESDVKQARLSMRALDVKISEAIRERASEWISEDMQMKGGRITSQLFGTVVESAWRKDREMAAQGTRKKILDMAGTSAHPWITFLEMVALEK